MPHRIHIFGASGSGTSTLGRRIAGRIGGKHLDTDDYYWQDTDPPFVEKRDPPERVEAIQRVVACVENWVLSGSICSWGDPLLSSFTRVVFVVLDPETRVRRLARREQERYGQRILPGGDMHSQHLEFMDWARSDDTAKAPIRSLQLHKEWALKLDCPVIRVDSSNSIEKLVEQVLD